MRIAILSPLEMRVPPVGYGGTELVVSLLTEGLVKKGHEVTLFASGDSVTAAKLVSICPGYLRGTKRNRVVLNLLNILACLEHARDFDIIHNHTPFEAMALSSLVQTPMLTTLHGDLKDDFRLLFSKYSGWYNTISYSAKKMLPEKERFAGVVYNAINVSTFPFRDMVNDNSYLLFLSRISNEKGPHLAIEVAKRLNRRLIIAGNIDECDEPYFKDSIQPEIDGHLIQFVGEADYFKKRKLMLQASCLLAPLNWEEPFGLFMIEAMACGTPVIALKRGAAPEIVVHNETGFVVETLEDMVKAVPLVKEIDRRKCRNHVLRKFNVNRMVDDYLRIYFDLLAQSNRIFAEQRKN